MDYLEEIIQYKQAHRVPAAADLERRVALARPPRSLLTGMGNYRTVVIAECKKSSPSAGVLVTGAYEPVELASQYQENGAAAISVLTDEKFFSGSLRDLAAVSASSYLPVLRKDFTLDETDLMEARANGADLVLLIARVLDERRLVRLLRITHDLCMEAIVEVHDLVDTQHALDAGSHIMGINNRDLASFKTDLGTTERLMESIPSQVAVISESGIKNGDDVARVRNSGVRAVLVGEALIRAADSAALLREMVDAGCPDCWQARSGEVEEQPSERAEQDWASPQPQATRV